MKWLLYFIFIIIIGFLALQLYRLAIQHYAFKQQLTELVKKIEPLQKENNAVESDLKALENSANIERELRRAGYAAPGEKVFIIVPKKQ